MTTPSRKDRTRPAELLALSGGLALFAALIVLMSTRDFVIAIIVLGVTFIVALIALAMLALATRPDDEEKLDLDEQNRGH